VNESEMSSGIEYLHGTQKRTRVASDRVKQHQKLLVQHAVAVVARENVKEPIDHALVGQLPRARVDTVKQMSENKNEH
jgi:hypothetical protein